MKLMKLGCMIVCLLEIGIYAQADEYDDMFESVMQGDESAQEEVAEKSQDGNDLEGDFVSAFRANTQALCAQVFWRIIPISQVILNHLRLSTL
jgi:hypothetical protein